jgi:hypothetical protein
MGGYQMNISLHDGLFSPEERVRLCNLFGIRNDDDSGFNNAIAKITHAAIVEYKEMLLGKGLPTRADEIRQHRLLHLIKYYFLGRIPTEVEVSAMFQLTETESRSLIKSVKTRFRYELLQEIRQTLRTVVEAATQRSSGEPYKVVIQSDNVLEELNQIIEKEAPHCYPITKCRSTAKTYEITEDSYQVIMNHFGQTVASQEDVG